MDFLRRQLRFRDFRRGSLAIITASVYLSVVALAVAYLLYYLVNPDPTAIGATFEGLPAIALTAPTSFFLSPVTGPLGYLVPGGGLLTPVLAGLVQAFVIYVLLRGRRRAAPEATAG